MNQNYVTVTMYIALFYFRPTSYFHSYCYTVLLPGSSILSRVLRHVALLYSYNFGLSSTDCDIFGRKYTEKGVSQTMLYFLSHLTGVSALPCETVNRKLRRFT